MSRNSKNIFSPQKKLVAERYTALIRQICQNNKHQMKAREYKAIADLVLAHAPVNFLVFGLGRDTPLWKMANPGGVTLFLENVQDWIDFSHSNDLTTEVYKVDYSTKRTEWKDIQDNRSRLMMDLPSKVTDRSWDIILVDSPGGAFKSDPGRMQSIFTAVQLKPQHIFLHDCDRPVEKYYFRKFISRTPQKIRKLWYARLASACE